MVATSGLVLVRAAKETKNGTEVSGLVRRLYEHIALLVKL